MNLSVLGISHQTAAVEVREALALPDGAARALLRTIRAEPVLNEALVLDTCNRTEVYCVAADATDVRAYLLERIAAAKGAATPSATEGVYRHDGTAAVRHLFRVAAGLDSQILGEHQVLAQTKAAYRQALGERTAGLVLNRLMHQAFRVGKRVRSETRLAEGGEVPVRELVPRRREEYERNLAVDLPVYSRGHPVPLTSEEREPREETETLTGIGVSPGKVTGAARVITDPRRNAEIKPGEILVAPVTDAAWTPLFVTAAATVVDVGGPLSHGGAGVRDTVRGQRRRSHPSHPQRPANHGGRKQGKGIPAPGREIMR